MAGGKYWWTSDEDYRYLEAYVVVIMCFLANFLEVIMHTLKRLVSARGHEGTRSHEDFFELLWSRATSELMVLGFLAFIVWCTARTGGFDAIAAMLPNPYEGCDPYIIAKYSPADLVHLRSKGRRLAAAESTCDGTYTKSEAYCIALGKARKHGRALLHFPTTGPDLLHVVEDVHMEIFVAMVIYFLMIAVLAQFTRQKVRRWSWWEENMREYAHYPHAEGVATARRLLTPLSDVKDFFKVKAFYVQWAQSGALRALEERRAKQLALSALPRQGAFWWPFVAVKAEAPSVLSSQSAPAVLAPGAGGGKAGARSVAHVAVVAPPVPYSPHHELRPDELDSAASAARPPGVADVRITSDFQFASYLGYSYARIIDDMIEFHPTTWSLVVAITVAEGLLIWYGVDAIVFDIAIALVDAALIACMWFASKAMAWRVVRSAERGRFERLPAWAERLQSALDIESFFIRLLQALTWRNLFRLVVFLLGEELRSIIGATARVGPMRIATLVVLSVSVTMLPAITIEWGLVMFLPPHINEDDVCWKQKHPLHSFSAPWEQPNAAKPAYAEPSPTERHAHA